MPSPILRPSISNLQNILSHPTPVFSLFLDVLKYEIVQDDKPKSCGGQDKFYIKRTGVAVEKRQERWDCGQWDNSTTTPRQLFLASLSCFPVQTGRSRFSVKPDWHVRPYGAGQTSDRCLKTAHFLSLFKLVLLTIPPRLSLEENKPPVARSCGGAGCNPENAVGQVLAPRQVCPTRRRSWGSSSLEPRAHTVDMTADLVSAPQISMYIGSEKKTMQ